MRKITFTCERGHDGGTVDDDGDAASNVALKTSRLRFTRGCDKWLTKSDRCSAKVHETVVNVP
jgi:hypothetical protein